MKTFKLKMLTIKGNNERQEKQIPLLDGLIINREDDKNQWIIEAYIEQGYQTFLEELFKKEDSLLLKVKITKENNNPAFFNCIIIGVNRIGDNLNVLFKGTIVDSSTL
ncbi:YwpF family protein [Oceanobacillus bengalensis]|uniref:Uncharacterized protein n=1 Tax=Oceanobacillus bengalensis TaxID=1435466 RepID=A0A494Z1M5_9BACI|nr:YwpF family protein [Oceanobacillus bengalensis]RKQ16379.1 hypothetical protein D8M05_07820 [Oceanobacillus bengalensis]